MKSSASKIVKLAGLCLICAWVCAAAALQATDYMTNGEIDQQKIEAAIRSGVKAADIMKVLTKGKPPKEAAVIRGTVARIERVVDQSKPASPAPPVLVDLRKQTREARVAAQEAVREVAEETVVEQTNTGAAERTLSND